LLRDTVEGNVARFQWVNDLAGKLFPNPAKDQLFVAFQNPTMQGSIMLLKMKRKFSRSLFSIPSY
jgi:hypothetical protein